MNYIDFACRIGTTVGAIVAGAVAGSLYGVAGGPAGGAAGAAVGAGIGIAGGMAKSGDICDGAAHDLQIRGECKAIGQEQSFRESSGQDIAAPPGIQREMYEARINECIEKGYLPPTTELQPPNLNDGSCVTPLP